MFLGFSGYSITLLTDKFRQRCHSTDALRVAKRTVSFATYYYQSSLLELRLSMNNFKLADSLSNSVLHKGVARLK